MAYSVEEKQKIFDDIIVKISGGLSLRKAIDELGSINKDTFLGWVAKDKDFADQYARAMEVRADVLFDEMLDIANDGSNDWMEKRDKDGELLGWQLNGEHVQRSKLRIDTYKWNLSKMQPKKYGDKIDLTSGGEKIQNGFPTLEQFYGKVEKPNE